MKKHLLLLITLLYSAAAMAVMVFALMCGLAEQAFPDKQTPVRDGAGSAGGGIRNEG